MAIDPETIGAGGGGGLLGTFLAWIGFKSRIDKQDKEIGNLKKDVLFKDVFMEYKEGINQRFDNVDKKLDNIWNKLK